MPPLVPQSARPGRRAQPVSRATALVLSASLGIIAAVLLAIFVVRLSNSGGGNKLGNPVLQLNATVISNQVVKGNSPVLFPDQLNKDRDIYVQHLATRAPDGWRAFRAQVPGRGRECTLTWVPVDRVFRDTRCGTGAEFPADGSGLEQFVTYTTGKERNTLVIDLRPGAVAPPTTTLG